MTYPHLLAAADSTDGLQVLNVLHGGWFGTFQKSKRGISRLQPWYSKELFGPPGREALSSGGHNKGSPSHTPIIIGRTCKESIDSIDDQLTILMHSHCTLSPATKQSWISGFFDFKKAMQLQITKLLGSAPDSPQPQYILKGAAVSMCIFIMLQSACVLNDPSLLRKNFQATWDREVTTLCKCQLGRHITLQTWEAILTIRNFSCTRHACLMPGQTAEICGACNHNSLTPHDPSSAQFKHDKANAKAIFVAANPSLLTPLARYDAFLLSHPQWHTSPAVILSQAAALTFIFDNQELIALPFHLA